MIEMRVKEGQAIERLDGEAAVTYYYRKDVPVRAALDVQESIARNRQAFADAFAFVKGVPASMKQAVTRAEGEPLGDYLAGSATRVALFGAEAVAASFEAGKHALDVVAYTALAGVQSLLGRT